MFIEDYVVIGSILAAAELIRQFCHVNFKLYADVIFIACYDSGCLLRVRCSQSPTGAGAGRSHRA